ncbi:MAG: pyridine nucleotide-disulfide oxidoreductase [Rhodospirillaceae bacterium]|nr:pyridine nucleotide-disulfide oxidoreductase [Rhodospirillaceae bacterium]|tara:strand:- start:1352 stop:2593 length:1242 start_codon:yes stop_codon:yes gene_type:complete
MVTSRNVTCVIIGAGHAGLAMSRCLTELSVDHVLLERGEVANSWRTERWDSLRLLTPNWQSRLPGFKYQGENPDGFRDMPEVIKFIDQYANFISAPVETSTRVTSVSSSESGYKIITNQGEWRCKVLVIASGACNIAVVPNIAEAVSYKVNMLTPIQYKNPNQLADGGVMIVGASATGTQLSKEIQLSGRQVTLSVGEHVRVPRVYRGYDIKWWMDSTGILDERYDDVDDINRARRVPSLQLTGSLDRGTLDLNTLTGIGVKLVGRMVGMRDDKALFSGSLKNVCSLADLKMNRLLDNIDEWITNNDHIVGINPRERFLPTLIENSPTLEINLTENNIKTIIWATGFRPDLSWLDVPVLDRKGQILHEGGIVNFPGMYLMGMQFLRRRKSSLIDGAGDDALDLSKHLKAYLDG